MKKIIFISIFFLGICLNLSGQIRPSNRDRSEPSEFAQRLWYGGAFNLGFSSFNRINQFVIGISPQVGYKIIEPFSIGPRASLQYAYFSTEGDSAHPLTWSVGVFTRYKVFWQIFAQLEYEYEDEALVNSNGFNGLEVFRAQNNNIYIGGGYNSSEGERAFGYEILLLYNVSEDPIGFESPYQFRFGFTYNF